MSYVVALPEAVSRAGAELASIGSAVETAGQCAAGPTTGLLAAATDEVSVAIAELFSAHGRAFQALNSQAAAFHSRFVQLLTGAAGAYGLAEAANASPLAALEQELLGAQHEMQRIPTTFAAGLEYLTTSPSSPLLTAFNGDNPLLGLVISNSPPPLLNLLLGQTVSYSTSNGMSVVTITPAQPTGAHVVAIHGGAFIFPATFLHWINYSVTAYQTGATFEVPIYPLVQQGGTAATVVPQMADFISGQIAQHGAQNVSVVGDSAGGNLALAAVQHMVQTNPSGPVPSSMVLLSPWLDLQSTGGPMGQSWAGNLAVTNPMVSPVFGSLSGLPPTYVYSGSADPLYPSALALQQSAIAHEIPMTFVLAPGQIHVWVLLTPWGLLYWPQINAELGIAS